MYKNSRVGNLRVGRVGLVKTKEGSYCLYTRKKLESVTSSVNHNEKVLDYKKLEDHIKRLEARITKHTF